MSEPSEQTAPRKWRVTLTRCVVDMLETSIQVEAPTQERAEAAALLIANTADLNWEFGCEMGSDAPGSTPPEVNDTQELTYE